MTKKTNGEEIVQMPQGTVKWFDEKKGYGFIKREDDTDLFVHNSSIDMSEGKVIAKGDRVSFDVEVTQRGPKATNVRKV